MDEVDRLMKSLDYELDKIIENSKKADTATAISLIRQPITLLFLSLLKKLEQKDKQIQELEENHTQRKQLNDAFEKGFIHKDKVKETLEYIEDYFDRLNGPDEDMNYIRKIKKELLEGDESDGT